MKTNIGKRAVGQGYGDKGVESGVERRGAGVEDAGSGGRRGGKRGERGGGKFLQISHRSETCTKILMRNLPYQKLFRLFCDTLHVLAHLSQRLIGELIGWIPMVRRPSVVRR